MADLVEGAGDVPAVEQEPRSFELPTDAEPAAEDTAPPADGSSSSSSSDDEKEKNPALAPGDELPIGEDSAAAAAAGGRWNQLVNHPYVTKTTSTLRQRAGQAQESIQPLVNHPYVQPIVNHPYVQKGKGAIYAGGTRTLETGKKVYNNEEGYEPKRLLPFFLATIGLVALGLIIRVLLQKYNPDFGALKAKFTKKE